MIPYLGLDAVWIGFVRVNMWGVLVACGFFLSVLLVRVRAKQVGISARHLTDLALWMFVGAIIGARLGFVLLYEPAYFLEHPRAIVALWHGGLSSIGGIVGAVGVFFLGTRHAHSRMRIADVIAFAFPFGWVIGRIGCFLVHDHPGTLSHSLLAVRFPDGPRLDMGLLEALGTLCIVGFVYYASRRPVLRGGMTAIVSVGYGVLRFVLDFFRPVSGAFAETRYSGLTPAQYGSLILIAVGIALWLRRGTAVDADRHGAGVV